MLLPMLLLPFATSFIAGAYGRKIGVTGTNILIIGTLATCTFFSFIIGYEVIFSLSSLSLEIAPWIDTGFTLISWGFNIDPLNAWLISTVLFISLLVHIFASSYMANDPNPQKFMSLLLCFTGSMVLLIAGDNLAVLFTGWELIGVTSYLLIGYWFDRAAACVAAGQAIIVNRIGDTFLTVALVIFICYLGTSGSLDLHDINLTYYLTSIANSPFCINGIKINTVLNIVGLLLVFAASGKSAQFLLHTWLPNAMEGPTPVSSLLHAATLVLGGVYLLLRCTSVLNVSSLALTIAALLGTCTALFAATTAIVQNDIKRTIAYSTCSQFGYLFASTGLSQSASTVLHLSSHAGFKALLFICAGGVIHSMRDEQDARRLGGINTLLPFTYSIMLIASLSLMAMPYLSGNVSKDLILELAAVYITVPGTILWLLGSFIAGATACYSVRLLALTFFGLPQFSKSTLVQIHEQPLGLIVPMIVLSVISIFFGYLAKEVLIGMGTDSIINFYSLNSTVIPNGQPIVSYQLYDDNYVLINSTMPGLTEAEFGLNIWSKNLPVICTMTGTLIGVFLFTNVFLGNIAQKLSIVPQLTKFLKVNDLSSRVIFKQSTFTILYRSLSAKWFVDSFYARFISWPVLNLALFTSKIVDRGILELTGPAGLSKIFTSVNNSLISVDGIIPKVNNAHVTEHKVTLNKFTNNIPDNALYIGIVMICNIFGLSICFYTLTSESAAINIFIILSFAIGSLLTTTQFVRRSPNN